ncbi:MAG: hypothetical protein AB7Q01_08620 [Gammaproteobacteria bacterium]
MLESIGLSVGAVGVLTPLVVALIKNLRDRLSLDFPRGSGTTVTAYVIGVLIVYALSLAGLGPAEQDSLTGVLVTVGTGLAGGAASQVVYAGRSAVPGVSADA